MRIPYFVQNKTKVITISTLKVALNWTTIENCRDSFKVVFFMNFVGVL